ncbi:MAG TPA: Hsp33 family molecular chaperone HslO [Thermoanaerobaculia bacterium]|nr:Hsp33 family molecular chaperone HslO [Thermoanaerobaculia bacterium]
MRPGALRRERMTACSCRRAKQFASRRAKQFARRWRFRPPMETQDRIIQGMAVEGHFRVLAAQTTTAVETAREILDLSPVGAEALGRAMTGALLLARLLAKDVRNQYVTLRFEGDGPLGTVIADGTISGGVRGYVENPAPEEAMDVESAIGNGSLTVIRGTPPTGKPYTSQILLGGSGIATDLTRYLMRSEQIASAVMLGVLNKRDGVAAAGGIVIQSFPGAPEEAIQTIEKRVREAPPLSTLLEKMEIEEAVATILHGADYKQVDSGYAIPVAYTCQCNRERALAPLALLGQDDLREMIDEGGTEVRCQFCGRRYPFSAEDLYTLTAEHDV